MSGSTVLCLCIYLILNECYRNRKVIVFLKYVVIWCGWWGVLGDGGMDMGSLSPQPLK